MSLSKPHPRFTDLPLNPSDPPYSAWGLYGPDDELGTLNLLTPERKRNAAKEIKTGVSVGLNWPLHFMDYTGAFRDTTKHELVELTPNVNDDKLYMNTQIGSQWDGLRHYGYDDGRFYNGLTQKEIYSGQTTKLGIHAWTRQGIVGRGVLIDFAAYAAQNGIQYDPLARHAVPLTTFRAIATSCGIKFQPGDIVFLRTGFTRAWEGASLAGKKVVMGKSPFEYVGMESTTSVVQFLWDTQIAAVAGDCPGFEAWPPGAADGGGDGELVAGMHPTLLSGIGMPIGEMFDLEALADECEKQKRWTFFVTSMPLNLRGGAASPPNATAVF